MSLLFNPIEDCFDLVGLTEATGDSIYLRQDQNLADLVDASSARTNLGLVAGGSGDIWVEKTGDLMSGQLAIDINSDTSAIKIVQNATQTTFPIQIRNSADSAYTSAIDANGRIRFAASTSSGAAWMSGDLSTSTYMTLNHTSAAGTFTNLAGALSFEGVATNEIVFNNLQADVNVRFESDTDANFLFLDAGLNTIAIGNTAQSLQKLSISQSHNSTGNPTTLVVNGTQTAAAATTLKGATFNLFMTHTSGSLSGGNMTEFNFNASGNGGTTGTIEGLNFNGSVGTGHTVSTLNYIHLYNPTVNGTLTTFRSILTEAGNIIFNESGGDYDVRIEGDTDTELVHVDASADAVGIGIGSPAAKLHVDQTSTTGAKPVLYLDQADVSEQMIQFETTIGLGNAIEAKGLKNMTPTHFVKVTIPGGLTRYFEVGTIA